MTDRGLGLPIQETIAELTAIKQHFPMVPETPLYPAWESLVNNYQVVGKNVHDARLVAAMLEHGIASILTFNTQDFVRYAAIRTLHPQSVAKVYPGG